MIKAHRLLDRPIIAPGMDARMGANINGPSLIRTRDWMTGRLGKYHLYFSDHKGSYIRLAHADSLTGPWTMHEPGCLDLAASLFCTSSPSPSRPPPYWTEEGDGWRQYLYPHIASPDVHVDDETQQVRMYFHGLLEDGDQSTRVAISADGVSFTTLEPILGPPYLRVFRWQDAWYATGFPNKLLRSADGLATFEPGPSPLDPAIRHTGVFRLGDKLYVFFTRFGDCPERIMYSCIDLQGNWHDWTADEPRELLKPQTNWEGADELPEASVMGAVHRRVNELRDPFVFEDEGGHYMIYGVAGEAGIGVAKIEGLT